MAHKEEINKVIKNTTSTLSLNLYIIQNVWFQRDGGLGPPFFQSVSKIIGERSADKYYYIYL